MFKVHDPVIIDDKEHVYNGYSGTVENIYRAWKDGGRNYDLMYSVRIHFSQVLQDFTETQLKDWRNEQAVVEAWTDETDDVVELIKSAPTRYPNAKVDLSPEGIANAWYGDEWGPRIKPEWWDGVLDWMVATMKRRGLL